LTEIAPKRFNRLFGTLHQISIGLGMMIAQSLSLVLSEAFKWRYVLLVGEGIALSLLLIGFLVGRPNERKDRGREEERRLLPPSDGESLWLTSCAVGLLMLRL
jgi:MFS family permease